MDSSLAGKNVLLVVTGGIAAYKAVELTRILVKKGADVTVAMTAAAQKFVTPLTFEAVSEKAVYSDMWNDRSPGSVTHIALAREADLAIVAPATADFVAKMAHGLADDHAATLMLAVTAPVLVCPSMNVHMFEHPATQANLKTLAGFGHFVMAPGEGFLACGDVGAGRLPEPADIADRAEALLVPKDLAGKKIVVTAGPTQEFIDPVRYISNPSSGKMGYAIARAAEHRGAEVVLVTGPVNLPPPAGVRVVPVTSAVDMAEAVYAEFDNAHGLVKAAAVSDYRVVRAADQKIKNSRDCESVDLCANPDILFELGQRKTGQVLVGFAAETEKLVENAREKLAKKNLDLIVANKIGAPGSGFATDTNKALLLFPDGKSEEMDLMTKNVLAHHILDRMRAAMEKRA